MGKMRNVYIIAGVLSLIIYISGIITGQYIAYNAQDSSELEKNISYIRSELENIQEEYTLLSFRGKESCNILSALYSEMASKLDTLSDKLRDTERLGQKGAEFERLKEDYATLAIRAWILNSNIKDVCEANIISALYFYTYPCEKCSELENNLEEMKSIYGRDKIIAYAIDYEINKSAVKLITKSYKIENIPSILIGNNVYGFLDRKELSDIVCTQLKNQTCLL